MFDSKQKLLMKDQQIARLVDERDEARQEAADAVRQSGRLANKVEENGTADAAEMARLRDVAENWMALASADRRQSEADKRRSERFGRALARCWAEIGRLRKTLDAREVSIKALQDRLADRDGGDRAVMPAVPRRATPAAELRDANERIAALEERLLTMQTANENADWRTHRAGAVLKQAS